MVILTNQKLALNISPKVKLNNNQMLLIEIRIAILINKIKYMNKIRNKKYKKIQVMLVAQKKIISKLNYQIKIFIKVNKIVF